jgi:hypothetical protein
MTILVLPSLVLTTQHHWTFVSTSPPHPFVTGTGGGIRIEVAFVVDAAVDDVLVIGRILGCGVDGGGGLSEVHHDSNA